MKSGKAILALCVSLLAAASGGSASQRVEPHSALRAAGLRGEYRLNPLAVGATPPHLGWMLASHQRAERQTAYQILVANSEAKLAANLGDLWNSGRVDTAQTIQIPYQGKPLSSRAICYWKVRVWDAQGRASSWSDPATWQMGLLNPSDWKARWIGLGTPAAQTLASPIFRRQFQVRKKVRRAKVYISGLGLFELHLNGRKVGRDVLEPGWTNYRKTCLYVTYDVTKLLRGGPNVLGVMLGNGMYNVVRGKRYVKFTGSFGPPKVILQLEITYDDGSSQTVVTDGAWRVVPSPITFNSIYGGEDYDARRAVPGWDMPGFDESKLDHATVMTGPGGKLIAQGIPPIRVMHVYEPVRITQPQPGVYVYDLGQNFSGWPQIIVRGPRGATVKLIPGELLDRHGLVTQRSSGRPAFFHYTLKGGSAETWHPRFSYYGFRYLEVHGATRDPRKAHDKPLLLAVKGQFVHSSASNVGAFSSSDPLFNRIHSIIKAAIESNMQSIMTDCPHREKLGWLEEDDFMGPSILYNFDVSTLFRKIERDMRDAQLMDGMVPDTAPEYVVFPGGFRDSPEWGSTYLTAAWDLYRWYGDSAILKRNYMGFKRYADYLTRKTHDHILSYGLGDWYDLGPKPPGYAQLTPVAITATTVYYHDLVLLQKMAARLGKTNDAAKYGALADEVKSAFNRHFFHATTDSYATGSQTSNAMPLVLGMEPEGTGTALLANIIKDVRSHGNKMTTGEIGHRYLLLALADAGRSDVVYDIESQTNRPGYGYILKQGATTLTEAWDANPRASQNHFMLGHLDEWFYRSLAGISMAPGATGFSEIVIKPQPVGHVTWAEASYHSIRGLVASHWSLHGRRFEMRVTLPPNTVATVYVPAANAASVTEGGRPAGSASGVRFIKLDDHGNAVYEIGSGTYAFASNIAQP
ncbi:MAG: family 78 glycoside hydrolase catalytic domain [Terriglobia bacterium]